MWLMALMGPILSGPPQASYSMLYPMASPCSAAQMPVMAPEGRAGPLCAPRKPPPYIRSPIRLSFALTFLKVSLPDGVTGATMNDPSGAVSFMWLPGVRTTLHPCFSAVRNSRASSFRDPIALHLPSSTCWQLRTQSDTFRSLRRHDSPTRICADY